MGLNVGDVVVEDGDIFGDGVNVAARLEGWLSLVGSVPRPGCSCLAANLI
jgi:class 3 adenylate cyclase